MKRLMGVGIVLLLFTGYQISAKDAFTMTLQEYNKVMMRVMQKPADITALFPKSEDEVWGYLEYGEDLAKKELQEVLGIAPQNRTFDNTVRALDESQAKLYRLASTLEFLSMVSTDDALRKAAHGASLALSEFSVDTYMSKELYQAFVEYQENKGKEEELTEQERYFVDETMKEFVRDGLHLSDEKLQKVKILNKEIAAVGLDFEQNLNTDNSSILATKEQLSGVDESLFARLKQEGDAFVVGCDYPTFFEVMQNCSVTDTRKRLKIAFDNRAHPVNQDLLHKLVAKRDNLAKQLGFNSYAALDIDSSMAATPGRVQEFLQGLVEASSKKAAVEIAELTKDLPESVVLDEKGRLYPWDYSFLTTAYKKKNFNIDERKIAEYFPADKALVGMLSIYEQFLNLSFTVVEPDWVWHKDVQLIQVNDKETEKLLGFIFLDLYPRENKYNHACCGAIVKGFLGKNSTTGSVVDMPYVGIVLANFPAPVAGKPALLKHSDVETFFHEFGHALHGVLGRAELSSAAGTSVKGDFVELPSQMLEEWMWDKEMLARVSAHYETGDPLPEELVDKKLALKKFDTGYFVLRQVWLSLLSLNLFLEGEDKDSNQISLQLHKDLLGDLFVHEPALHMHSGFGHLVGYGSRYYGYMWSRVFALDCFAKIKKHGLVSYEIGERWRNGILGMGGAADPNDLLKEFLGREPNQEAFFKELGF